jgi:peptidyl-prolyl cis-trans isomerase-like protein 2
MFITATEWATEYGGKKTAQQHGYRPLPFNHCAISLSPYETPCCTPEGVLFDLANLVPYVMKHKKNPVTGASMTTQDIIRLNMAKNSGEFYAFLFSLMAHL